MVELSTEQFYTVLGAEWFRGAIHRWGHRWALVNLCAVRMGRNVFIFLPVFFIFFACF